MSRWNPDRARKLIEERGLTRRYIAKQCLITLESLHQILMGRKPGSRTVTLLAITLGTNGNYLTGKSDDPSPGAVA